MKIALYMRLLPGDMSARLATCQVASLGKTAAVQGDCSCSASRAQAPHMPMAMIATKQLLPECTFFVLSMVSVTQIASCNAPAASSCTACALSMCLLLPHQLFKVAWYLQVGRHFEGFEPGASEYTPNAYLRTIHPDG